MELKSEVELDKNQNQVPGSINVWNWELQNSKKTCKVKVKNLKPEVTTMATMNMGYDTWYVIKMG
jgi:hypothetical protein